MPIWNQSICQKKNMTRLLKSTVLTYDLINFYSETARCWKQMPLWIQRMFYCFAIIQKFHFFLNSNFILFITLQKSSAQGCPHGFKVIY
jgi:hypothetical protein